MPLIKLQSGDDIAVQDPTLESIESRASRIVQQARVDAGRILTKAVEEAQSHAQVIHEAARQEGHEAGRAEGYRAGEEIGRREAEAGMREQLETLHATWSNLLDEWIELESARRMETSRQALVMAIKLGERVVHRQVDIDPMVVIDQVRLALDMTLSPTDLEIVVAEVDRTRVHHALPGLLERFQSVGYVSIKGCEIMKPGGCRLQMRGGEIDARLETQLERLGEAILPIEMDEKTLVSDGEAA